MRWNVMLTDTPRANICCGNIALKRFGWLVNPIRGICHGCSRDVCPHLAIKRGTVICRDITSEWAGCHIWGAFWVDWVIMGASMHHSVSCWEMHRAVSHSEMKNYAREMIHPLLLERWLWAGSGEMRIFIVICSNSLAKSVSISQYHDCSDWTVNWQAHYC